MESDIFCACVSVIGRDVKEACASTIEGLDKLIDMCTDKNIRNRLKKVRKRIRKANKLMERI